MTTKAIWKYHLTQECIQYIDCPITGQVRHVGLDGEGKMCLWLSVDTDDGIRYRELLIAIVGTGLLFDDTDMDYIGTVTLHQFVWHIFIRRYDTDGKLL